MYSTICVGHRVRDSDRLFRPKLKTEIGSERDSESKKGKTRIDLACKADLSGL